MRDPERVRPGL